MYLSKRGYVVVKSKHSPTKIKQVKKELTVKPFVSNDYASNVTKFPVFLENQNKLYLPKHYGLKHFGEPEEDKTTGGLDIDLDFKGTLREKQKPVIADFLDTCKPGKYTKRSNGGIISVPCGFGKTCCGLYLICKLKKKALVIVHKEFLLNQWVERIKQFIPDARIGRIQAKTIDIHNKDIVIGMLQSISMKDYPKEVFEDFGFTIIDEAHHISSEVFSKALPKIATKYTLGLSATPKRKDGLSKVFHWYLGPMIYPKPKDIIKNSKENKIADNTKVNIVFYSDNDKAYCKEELTMYGKMCMPKMINNICGFKPRTRLIIEITKRMINKNRRTLILSDRRAHLKTIYEIITESKIGTIGYYVGGMKQSALEESAKCQVVLGTFQMASEGMDVPELDTIILASPKSNVEQSVGRVQRKVHKNGAIIWDIVDQFSVFPRQYAKRKTFYQSFKKTTAYTKKKYPIYQYWCDDGSYCGLDKKGVLVTRKNSRKNKKKEENPFGGKMMIVNSD